MKKIKSEKGFTLIELLLVVAIVSVLASLFIFNSTQAKEKAQDAKMVSESHQIEIALDMYKEETGFMPLSISSSAGRIYMEDTDEYAQNLQPLVNKGLIPSIPKSSDGKSYAYGVSTDKQNAIFMVKLRDGQVHSAPCKLEECSFIQPSDDCGLPPYIDEINEQYANGYDDYIREMIIIDPEEKEIILTYSPNQTNACNVLNPNATVCNFYPTDTDIPSRTIEFTYGTENCPVQTASVTITNPHYIPEPQMYTLTINVAMPSDDNTLIRLYNVKSSGEFGEPVFEPIVSPVSFPQGENVTIFASAYNSVMQEFIGLSIENCDSGQLNGDGTLCDLIMNGDRTIGVSEIQ